MEDLVTPEEQLKAFRFKSRLFIAQLKPVWRYLCEEQRRQSELVISLGYSIEKDLM